MYIWGVENMLQIELLAIFKMNEMGGACGAYEGGERCAQGSGGETW
jgi:hypothetical protein